MTTTTTKRTASQRARKGLLSIPNDVDAEAAVLGAMLLAPEAVEVVAPMLSAGDFYRPAHGFIFDAVCALAARGEHVDAVTVADLLRGAGTLDAIGGPSTLVTLQAGTPSTTGAAKYARIIAGAADRRALIALGGELEGIAYGDPDATAGAQRAAGAWDRYRARLDARSQAVASPVEPGWATLDAVSDFLSRYAVFPDVTAPDAVALWIAHTWVFDQFEITPRLALLSAEKRSGKTRTLKLVQLLARQPRRVSNVSAAYLFRRVERDSPTILVDEVDAIFGPKAGSNHEDLRALINDGWEYGATVGRIIGEGSKMEPHDFPAFAPVALAGIGNLPDTITDRAVLVRMRRRTPAEAVTAYRRRRIFPESQLLRDRLALWAGAQVDLGDVEPDLPDGIGDRAADLWEPLVAIADAAGGDWPERARAAVTTFEALREVDDESWRVALLAEVVACFDEGHVARLTSAELLASLTARQAIGVGTSPHRLASWLRPFDIRAQRAHGWRGYVRADFDDAVSRYLLPTPVEATQATQATRDRASAGAFVSDRVGRVASWEGGKGDTGSDAIPPGEVVDLPVDVVGVCRLCGLACVTRDPDGPVHPLCLERDAL